MQECVQPSEGGVTPAEGRVLPETVGASLSLDLRRPGALLLWGPKDSSSLSLGPWL